MRYWLFIVLFSFPALLAAAPLDQREYRLLSPVYQYLDAGQLDNAYQQLIKARQQVSSDYAKALVEHNLGNIELQRAHYSRALVHLTRAYGFNQLEKQQQLNLAHTLAQLNCVEENWQACINLLDNWMTEVPDSIKDTDYLLLAQAYSQLENWSAVIESINKAIIFRGKAPENWYELKVAAHLNLKQWHAAIKAQQQMMQYYADKPRHWRQLVALHLQVRDMPAALASQRIGYQRGLLANARDYRLLVQMLLSENMPFYAGEVMQAGLDKGVLRANQKNLDLLSRAWVQARETDKAVSALARLNEVSPTRDNLSRLAKMQIELEHWQAAEATLLKVLAMNAEGKSQGKGHDNGNDNENRAYLHLLLGITRIKLQDYDNARVALDTAALNEQVKSSAAGWLQYMQQVTAGR